jgi:HEPN domain-containing protein
MTPSEARARETREWLGKAAEDLISAHVLIGSNRFSGALFFCQQAAEKSLKAFLTWHEHTFRRTHDLEELGKDCQAIDPTLAALIEEADILSDYAWKLRYPGAPYTPERAEAEAMFGIASRVLSAVQSRLPLEARISDGYVDDQS